MANLVKSVSVLLELSCIHVNVLTDEVFYITSGYDGEFSEDEKVRVELSGSNCTDMRFCVHIKSAKLFQKAKRNNLIDSAIKDAREQLDNIPFEYNIWDKEAYGGEQDCIFFETVYPRGLLIYSSIRDFNSCDHEELSLVIYNNIIRYLKFIHIMNETLSKYSLK